MIFCYQCSNEIEDEAIEFMGLLFCDMECLFEYCKENSTKVKLAEEPTDNL